MSVEKADDSSGTVFVSFSGPNDTLTNAEFPGAILSWHGIRVEAKTRSLLDGVSAIAFPGQVVALMGASGAGKTTLLNTLVRRNLAGLQIEGEVRVNGTVVGRDITGLSSYIQQEDQFVGNLTVREQIALQANLGLTGSPMEIRQRIEGVIKILKLEHCAYSRIGSFDSKKRGISGLA